MERHWNNATDVRARPAPADDRPAGAPITDWVQLGRAVLAETARRTTQELISRRCGKLRRAVQDALQGGAA